MKWFYTNKSKNSKQQKKNPKKSQNPDGSGFKHNIRPTAGNPEPFGRYKKTTFRFVGEGFIPVGNARSNYLMSVPGNGLYEPGAANTNSANTSLSTNLTAVTGSSALATAQPFGYSYYSNMYRYYRVKGSRIKVTVFSPSGSDALQLAVWPANEVSASLQGYSGTSGSVQPSGAAAAQMPYGKSIITTLYADPNSGAGNSISLACSTAKVNGLTERQFDEDVVNAVGIGANPSLSAGGQDTDLPWSWWISVADCVNGNFAGNVLVKVEVEYDAIMTEPNFPIA
jgi:hypothetical protein